MSIAAETKQQVAEIGEKYKYGFVTDIEMDMAPRESWRRAPSVFLSCWAVRARK